MSEVCRRKQADRSCGNCKVMPGGNEPIRHTCVILRNIYCPELMVLFSMFRLNEIMNKRIKSKEVGKIWGIS